MREKKTFDDLYGLKRWRELPAMLQLHDPHLLWDRVHHPGGHSAIFFRNHSGRWIEGVDGKMEIADDSVTNMTLDCQLGMPLVYDAREIRFYPATREIAERWANARWRASVCKNVGDAWAELKLEAHDHLALPEPDNFSKDEIFSGRVDLVERAKPIRDIVNRGHLPCLVAKLERRFYSLDLIGFNFQQKLGPVEIPDLEGKFSTYAVMIGGIWFTAS